LPDYIVATNGIDDVTKDQQTAAGGELGATRRIYRERQRRLAVTAIVTLDTGSGGIEANLCDVSEKGVKIESDAPLPQGPVTVKMIGFPAFSGNVRWHGGRGP
jgi:PilZ domain